MDFLFGSKKLMASIAVSTVCGIGLSACGGGDPLGIYEEKPGIHLASTQITCSASADQYCVQYFIARAASGKEDSGFQYNDQANPSLVSDITKEKLADGSWKMKVSFRKGLPVGTYTGQVYLNLWNLPTNGPVLYTPTYLQYTLLVTQ